MTGRKSLQMLSNQTLFTSSFAQYSQVKQTSRIVKGTQDANRIETVGNRIKTAAENYYRSIGRLNDLNGYEWEFILIEDKNINAWCMPGGKVAFFTGILPVAQNDAGIATVMGHEVAHALAGHGNERMSQMLMVQGIAITANVSISNEQWRNTFNQLYPIGAGLTVLSYSRRQELDADQMGLYLMAKAGYDPREAPRLWERMKQATAGLPTPPTFLSTHPNPDQRISDMNKNMSRALEYYQQAIKASSNQSKG